jgi:hypothetical protein
MCRICLRKPVGHGFSDPGAVPAANCGHIAHT